ncbi:hypothetical protein KIAC18_000298 [Sporomusa sphaeroides]|uniref:hypothetical protein n=1 Tax=Sporomusa sphaeroides TaxID=47679 RepID=UPI003DA18651
MKRIALILVLIMVLGMAVASAEITQGKDKFTGGNKINSVTETSNPSELKQLVLRKIITGNSPSYELWGERFTTKNFLFKKTFLEMKIDDTPIISINVKETSAMTYMDGPNMFSWVTVPISSDIVEQIKIANRIALRFQTASGSYVYVLPDAVLAEWKEVIAAEK